MSVVKSGGNLKLYPGVVNFFASGKARLSFHPKPSNYHIIIVTWIYPEKRRKTREHELFSFLFILFYLFTKENKNRKTGSFIEMKSMESNTVYKNQKEKRVLKKSKMKIVTFSQCLRDFKKIFYSR